MQLLDGNLASRAIRGKLELGVREWKQAGKRPPHLACILIGHNGASETYVAAKIRACEEIGFRSTLLGWEEKISEPFLLEQIQGLNLNPEVDGILVQLPLPGHIRENAIIQAIAPQKDVDGFHPVNLGNMVIGLPGFIPATPYGILLMLDHYQIQTRGMHAVVVGRSHIVGTPMSILLSRNAQPGNCTVTLCHSQTRNLKEYCLQADLLVTALGRPGYIGADMVAEGAVVVDVGISRIPDPSRKSGFRLSGDIRFEEVAPKCRFITPVPGGVGPMTIAGLLQNTFRAARGTGSQ